MADEANVRPSRAEEVRQERRRKPGSTVHYGIKLSVPEDQLDRNTYVYRHVNDVGNRIAQMEAEDWDKAPLDGNSVSARHVGTDEGGKSIPAVLMRKRKDWYNADQKEKQKPLDEIDEAIRRGTAHQKSGEGELSGVAYTPGTNSIEGVTFRGK